MLSTGIFSFKNLILKGVDLLSQYDMVDFCLTKIVFLPAFEIRVEMIRSGHYRSQICSASFTITNC